MPAAAAASPLLERGALIGEQHSVGHSAYATPLQICYRQILMWSTLSNAMTLLHPMQTGNFAPEASWGLVLKPAGSHTRHHC